MTTTSWTILGLIALLTALNSIAVIALVRQVGLLHLRLRPVPALDREEGPQPGAILSFSPPPGELVPSAERVVLGFFSPTCGVCGPLMPAFQSLASTLSAEEGVVLVTDVDAERARDYLGSKKIRVPVIAEESSFKANGIPGSPYVAVIDRESRVLTRGTVNTLEQIELLLEAARSPEAQRDGTHADRVPAEAVEVAYEGLAR